ncbi:MAG TPA: GNAT family N-acetyltransferase [Ideonella sp.]|nr:GNAT family N-acetyltransferase [Ideonella sp.]
MNGVAEETLAQAHQAATVEADGVNLRPMGEADLEAAHALSVEVEWPHRLEDWRFVAALGEGFVAERDGQIVGTAIRWPWGEDHATLGMVIVAPQLQGRRVGQRLMQALMAGLEGRAVTLHATVEGRGLYERLGFVAQGEVRQHQGIAQPAPLVVPGPGLRLRPLGRGDAEHLIGLDRRASGMPRGRALRILLDTAEGVVLDNDGEAVGFSLLRRFGRGHAIGPVVAPDLAGAQALIAHWTGLLAQKFVRIDVEAHSGLIEWLEGQGLQRVGSVVVMSRGEPPQRGPSQGLYALINQALG